MEKLCIVIAIGSVLGLTVSAYLAPYLRVHGAAFALPVIMLLLAMGHFAGFCTNPAYAIGLLQTIYFCIFLARFFTCQYGPLLLNVCTVEESLCVVTSLWGFILSDIVLYLAIVVYAFWWDIGYVP